MESPKLKHVLHSQPLDADDPILSEDDIGKVLADAGEVTFSELKTASSFFLSDLDGRASKKDVNDLLDFCEKKYASASDIALVASQLDTFASKSEVVQLASYVSTQIDAIKTNTVDVTLSAAQVLALGSTAITLVLAPGSGKYVEVVRVEMFLDYNSVAYTGSSGKDVSIEHSSGGTPLISIGCSGLMDQTSDQRRGMNHATAHEIVMNEAVVVKTLGGNLAAGNSPLKIRVDYRLITALV